MADGHVFQGSGHSIGDGKDAVRGAALNRMSLDDGAARARAADGQVFVHGDTGFGIGTGSHVDGIASRSLGYGVGDGGARAAGAVARIGAVVDTCKVAACAMKTGCVPNTRTISNPARRIL